MTTLNMNARPAASRERPLASADVAALVSGLGRAINVAVLYGQEHRLALATIDEILPLLTPVLSRRSRTVISLVGGDLQVDGLSIDSHTAFANVIAGKLKDLNMTGLALLQGLTADEFRGLVKTLATLGPSSPPQAVADAFERGGLRHVVADKAVYKRVSANEPPAAKTAPGIDPSSNKLVIGQILAFLKGDGASSARAADAVRDMASSPEKLAQLIMEATVIRQSTTNVASGESLADLVVGCLRRTLDAVVSDTTAQTQEGRVNLRKSLMVLEQCVLDRLRQAGKGPQPDIDRVIKRVFRDAQDDLEVSTVATEYVRRREALDKVEQWMVSYMQSRPDQGSQGSRLEQRLKEAGLSPENWQELVQKNGAGQGSGGAASQGDGTGGSSSPPIELGVLSILLSQLDALMSKESVNAEQASALAEEASAQAASLAQKTGAKMKKLGKQIDRKAANAEDKSPAELLAEIAQELAQPISVLNCTVDMLTRGCLGAVLPQQREMLTIARGCGMRVSYLLDQLRRAVGLPESLTPISKQQLTRQAPR